MNTRAIPVAAPSRTMAYVALTKPDVSFLVVLTTLAGYALGAVGPLDWLRMAQTVIGTTLVAAGTSALNHYIERDSDARMRRTASRPLPTGTLAPAQALWFGVGLALAGVLELLLTTNILAASLAALTSVLYLGVYTPLKTRTPLNTVVGAVAGALPTLMGWTAVGGSLSFAVGGRGLQAATLFLIVYLWQFPHFMAIAWIYRRQYAAAGLKMLTVVDPSGRRAGGQAVAAALALTAVSLVPVAQYAGWIYFGSALALGLAYLAASARFGWRRDEASARRLLAISLVYLPVLLALLMFVPLI